MREDLSDTLCLHLDIKRRVYSGAKSAVIGILVRKRAHIRNRYNQAPHLTQDTNGKVTTPQLDITNESQEVSPVSAGDHKALTKTDAHESITKQDRNNINDP